MVEAAAPFEELCIEAYKCGWNDCAETIVEDSDHAVEAPHKDAMGEGCGTFMGAVWPKLSAVLAALQAVPAASGEEWQPIESAPKDGKLVVLWQREHGLHVARWSEAFGDWHGTDWEHTPALDPTHWMRPEPPALKASVRGMMRGAPVECARCGGKGMTQVWANEYEECADCGGSGKNWRYPGGAIARYYSGPLLGRAPTTQGEEKGR
jgi:hypothetical protein